MLVDGLGQLVKEHLHCEPQAQDGLLRLLCQALEHPKQWVLGLPPLSLSLPSTKKGERLRPSPAQVAELDARYDRHGIPSPLSPHGRVPRRGLRGCSFKCAEEEVHATVRSPRSGGRVARQQGLDREARLLQVARRNAVHQGLEDVPTFGLSCRFGPPRFERTERLGLQKCPAHSRQLHGRRQPHGLVAGGVTACSSDERPPPLSLPRHHRDRETDAFPLGPSL